MKKKDIVLIGVVAVILIGGILLGGSNNTSEDDIAMWTQLLDDTILSEGINDMSYDYYKAFYNMGEGKQIIYIGSSSCSWCSKFSPVLEEIGDEYGTRIIYINVANLTQSEYNALKTSTDNNFSGGTPTTLIMENGEVIDKLGGYVEKEKAVEFFRANGVLDGE